MATVNVTQYEHLAGDSGGKLGQAGFHDGNETVGNTTYTASTGLTVGTKTHYLRLNPDSDLYYRVGAAATATSTKLDANVIEIIGIKPGATIYFYDGVS